MLSSNCLEITTFSRHQQRLFDDLQISEAENSVFFRLAFDRTVHVWPPQSISVSFPEVTTPWRLINQCIIIIIIVIITIIMLANADTVCPARGQDANTRLLDTHTLQRLSVYMHLSCCL